MPAPTLRVAGRLTLIEFPPDMLGLYVQPVGPDQGVPLTADQVLRANPSVVALLNGPMFDLCPGQPDDYGAYTCGRFRYLHADAGAGVLAPGTNPSSGLTIAVVNGQGLAFPGAADPPGATFALQLYPALVAGGAVQPVSTGGSNLQTVWRSGLALMNDGRAAFAFGAFTLAGFAQALADAGAVTAGYTDGGGSTTAELRDGPRMGSTENRRVPSWIVAVPPAADAGMGTGVVAVVGGLVVAGSAFAAWRWWQGRKRAA